MRNLLRLLGMVVAIAGTIAFIAYAVSHVRFADLAPHMTTTTLLALVGAALLYGCTVPLSAWAWQRLLVALGSSRGQLELNEILLTTQIGKYLPGNVGQHIGRVGMSLSRGIPAAPLVASMAYEIVLLLLAGVLTGIIAGLFSPAGERLLYGHADKVALATSAAVLGLLLAPLLARLLPRVLQRLRPDSTGSGTLRVGGSVALLAFAVYVVCYLLIAAGIALLSVAMFPDHTPDFALLLAAFALAWVVGFVTPGAPAGMGVREGILVLLLGGPLGPAAATALILALRVTTMLGDILCLLTGLALRARNRQHAGPGMTSTHRTDS